MTGSASQISRFCKIWADNITVALASYGVSGARVSVTDPETTSAPSPQEFEHLVCIRFSSGKALKGELLWVAEKTAAKQVARLLTGAAPVASAASAELTDEDRDAFAEFLRQAAGQTATSWKAELGSEIDLVFQTTAVPAPVTAQCVTLQMTGENFAAASLRFFLDADLNDALAAVPAPPPPPVERPAEPVVQTAPPPPKRPAEPAVQTAPPPAPAPLPVPPPRTEPLPTNLGLVLDVTLEATIRFGEREMLLRDIFGLMAGAVVELNQMVNEPAELHVAGRLVARGEVVVVDGNFGLRVTEVASINERVAAINF